MDFPLPFPLFMAAMLLSCSEPQPTTGPQTPTATMQTVILDEERDTTRTAAPQVDRSTVPFDENGTRYTWTIVPAANGTFGFVIYDRGKLYIDQQKAPGLAGPDGWKKKLDARAAVVTTMEKLEKGEVPEGMNVVGQ